MSDNYFVHESSYIDDDVIIGEGTKIWHFCHVQSGARIGNNCSFGQNVNISNNVIIGNGVKVQNNVSLYEGVELEDGVFCGPSCVFTNDLTPRAEYPKGHVGYKKTLVKHGTMPSGSRERTMPPLRPRSGSSQNSARRGSTRRTLAGKAFWREPGTGKGNTAEGSSSS